MPNVFRWIYDQGKKLYQKARGRSVPREQMIRWRDEYTQQAADLSASMTRDLFDGKISIQQWTLNFRETLKQDYINQYRLGRGGTDAMTQADWGRIGRQLRDQYAWMNRFAAEIQHGNLSASQIEARMRLYFNSATQMYERGQAASAGLVLPQYPSDGRTQCRTNCKCEWNIKEYDDRWDCFWLLNPAEHCPDCVDNSQKWNPLVIVK